MIPIASITGLRRLLSGFAGDRRGVSAVEFAMVLPLMLTLYLGAVEISQGISIDRKVTLTARTVADLVSQAKTINNNEMTNLLTAASAVMAPYPAASLKVTVSSVTIDAQNRPTVAWSDTFQGAAHARGAPVTLPNALLVANTTLIWSEVQYDYKPTVGYVVTGTLNLSDQIYMRPRLSDAVARTQ